MTVKSLQAIIRFIGLSTDTKPTSVSIGSTFYEYDTKRMWITYDGTLWVVKDEFQSISDNRKIVTTAGTRVALVASSTRANWVIITAETDNTGIIVVGGSGVIAALATRQGTPLGVGDTIALLIDDLVDVYIDTTVDGDGVTFTYGL